MPNRILREGILTSRRMAKLGWAEEVFYRRLMSVVDDFGRYYADEGLLHSACYPRQLNKVSDADIGKWLTSCVNAGLVSVYRAADRESYLQLLDFGQQVRAKKSRFPDSLSTCVADAQQVPADAPVFVDESVSVGVVEKGARKRAPPPPCPEDVSPQVWADWVALRKGKDAAVSVTAIEGARSEAEKAGISFEAFLRVWCVRGSQGLQAEWLKPSERGAGAAPQSFAQKNAADSRAAGDVWMGSAAPSKRRDYIDMEDRDAARLTTG